VKQKDIWFTLHEQHAKSARDSEKENKKLTQKNEQKNSIVLPFAKGEQIKSKGVYTLQGRFLGNAFHKGNAFQYLLTKGKQGQRIPQGQRISKIISSCVL
jgi:hypothetical protein